MSSKHNSFVLTTKSDQSLGFFVSKNTTIAYFEDTDVALETLLHAQVFDVIYIRDPFNTGDYSLDNISRKIALLRTLQPHAQFVDNIKSLDDVLVEDKWKQYEIVGQFMAPTVLATNGLFVEGKHIAKKRVSARSKDILFSVQTPLDDKWIIQDLIPINEELRIYVVHGKVMPQATIKTSKSNGEKVKVVGIRPLSDMEAAFAQAVVSCVPQLDFVGLDVAVTRDGLMLIEVNRSPQFKRYNELSSSNIIEGFFDTMHERGTVLGIFEDISFPELGIVKVFAKVDTGAYSGALHCTDIKVFRRGKDKKRILKFVPLGNKKYATETDTFDETYVRSSSGHRIKRYVIATSVVVQGKTYSTRIGLSNRSDMKREALLGRRFLRENNLLVDVRINSEYDDEGENTR